MTEAAVVPKDSYPVQWVGRQAVVTLPEHINVSNAGQIREELLTLINRGAATLIADMTATLSCDHAGAEAVGRAYQRALANGTQLRLVVTAHIVRRVLSLNGLDRLIPIYPSLEAAIAAGAPAAEGSAETRISPEGLCNCIHSNPTADVPPDQRKIDVGRHGRCHEVTPRQPRAGQAAPPRHGAPPGVPRPAL
jgi:anti-sigma B factor antagonist